MSFKRAIYYGKEHRKEFRGAKKVNKSCRCHGGCPYCTDNRLHSTKVRLDSAEEEMATWRNPEETVQFKNGYDAYMNDSSLREGIFERVADGWDWEAELLSVYSDDYVAGVKKARERFLLEHETEIV